MNDQIKINFEKIAKTLNLSKENIDLRKKNLSQFIENGFPNKKKEDWKFSDLNAIISKEIKKLKYFDENILEEKEKKISFDKFPTHITKNNFITYISLYIISFVKGPVCLNIIFPSLLIINVSGSPKTPNSKAIFPSWSNPTNE